MSAVEINGLDALMERLGGMDLPGAAESALPGAAEGLAEEARALAPVNTGELKESIHVAADGPTASVAAGAGHARYVELGTFRVAPRPFLLPAYARRRESIVSAIAQAVAREIGGSE